MTQDIVRVLRLVEYEGPRDKVEAQLLLSLHGTRFVRGSSRFSDGNKVGYDCVRITAVTLDQFPRILEEARQIPDSRLQVEARDLAESALKEMEKKHGRQT